MNSTLPTDSALSSTGDARAWAAALVGRPYRARGRGPSSFDCWGLCAYVWTAHFGLPYVPDVGCDRSDSRGVLAELRGAEASGLAARISSPVHGCAVYMSRSARPSHVGIFLDLDGGVVLHATVEAGVLLTRLRDLRFAGLNVVGFYLPGWTRECQ